MVGAVQNWLKSDKKRRLFFKLMNCLALQILSKMELPTGNQTPVSRVTGGDTDHYTIEEIWGDTYLYTHVFGIRDWVTIEYVFIWKWVNLSSTAPIHGIAILHPHPSNDEWYVESSFGHRTRFFRLKTCNRSTNAVPKMWTRHLSRDVVGVPRLSVSVESALTIWIFGMTIRKRSLTNTGILFF